MNDERRTQYFIVHRSDFIVCFGVPMPVNITMPQLSDTMTEGTLIKWYKKEGDKISLT